MRIHQGFSGESIISQIPSVINWLESFGFNALCSRYSRYVKYIDEFFNLENPDSNEGREKFERLTKAYRECFEIVIIKNVFGKEKSDGFKNRLAKVIKGADYLEPKPVDEARDYLFELIVAARFSRCGYQLDFDALTDVIAKKKGYTIYAECKRISSEKRFEENFIKAGKQLQREIKNPSENNYGLIFIDISSCIFEDLPKSEVDNEVIAGLYLDKAMCSFVQRESYHIDLLNEKFSTVSLAVCLMGQAQIYTSNLKLNFVMNTKIHTWTHLSDNDFNTLNYLLKDFD
jgi:hypothetical protein